MTRGPTSNIDKRREWKITGTLATEGDILECKGPPLIFNESVTVREVLPGEKNRQVEQLKMLNEYLEPISTNNCVNPRENAHLALLLLNEMFLESK